MNTEELMWTKVGKYRALAALRVRIATAYRAVERETVAALLRQRKWHLRAGNHAEVALIDKDLRQIGADHE